MICRGIIEWPSGGEGVYKNGRVELTAPVDLPEGCEVRITPCDSLPIGNGEGLDEAPWLDTPENRECLIAEWEALEPPIE